MHLTFAIELESISLVENWKIISYSETSVKQTIHWKFRDKCDVSDGRRDT